MLGIWLVLRHEVYLQAAKDCLQATNEKKPRYLFNSMVFSRLRVWLVSRGGSVPHAPFGFLSHTKPLVNLQKPTAYADCGSFR